MEVRKGISSRRALLLGFLLGGSSMAQMALAINVGFDPATLNLSAGERALVAVTVTDMPAPGLAALEFELTFDPSLINLYNPNEAYKASGITSFAPLAGNPFCPIVRGDDISDPCSDPEWFLTSSGRTAESGAAVVDNLTGHVLMSFGTTSPPSEQPTGDGVVALIEVEGTGNGSGAVSFEKGILADATPTPYQGISFDTLIVNVGGAGNQAPSIDPIQPIAINEGGSVTVAVAASDNDGDSLSFSSSGMPDFVSLSDNGDGTADLTVSPSYGDAGSYAGDIRVTDDGSPASSTTTSVDISVLASNRPPQLDPILDRTSAEGESVVVTASASDPDGDTLLFSASGLPDGVVIDSVSGNITGVVGYETAGSYAVAVRVTDSGVPSRYAEQTFVWEVANSNRAPELGHISDVSLAEGETLSIPLSATDADGDNLAYSTSGLPSFVTLSGNVLLVAPGFEDAGSYPVVVEVSDGTDLDSQNFTVVVSGTNQAPSISSPDDQNNVEGDIVNFALAANDADGDALTYAATGLPAGISIDPSSGVISGALDYESEGTYNVSVTVTDDGSPALNASASFTWTVSETNRAPELAAVGDQSVEEGDTLIVTLNATDADGDALTYSATGLPAFASLSGNTLTLAPDFEDAASYPVTVEVSDGTDADTQSFTIVVGSTNRAPVLDSVSDQTVAEGDTLAVTLNATDADGDSLTYSSSDLPAFVSLSGNTLTLAPGFDEAGSYPVTVEVSDGTETDSQTFTIVVGGTNQAPTVTSPTDQASAEGDTVNLVLTANDADGDALTYAATGLPAGISIDPSSGVISGALDYESEGTHNVSVTVTDDGAPALNASASFTWTVAETNRAPELAAVGDQSVEEGDTLIVTLNATDADGDALTYSASGLPAFVSLSGNTLTLMPGFEDAGSYPVTIEVSDGVETDSQSFTIVVGGTNQAPSITTPGGQANSEGDSVNLTLTASDADGDALTFAATGLPANVSIDPSSGVISGVLDYESEGTYNVTVTATDDGAPALNASASFTWTVAETNRAPELAAVGDQSVEEGDTLIVTLNATDADGDALTYSASGLPAFVSLSGNTLTLMPGFEDAGSYPVTVEVSDGMESDSQTFTITVDGTNRAPVLDSVSDQTVAEGDVLAVTLSATDADGDSLTYSASGLPDFVSLGGNTLSVAPGFEDAGSYPVTVEVSDGVETDSQTFTIVVDSTNRAPVLDSVSDQTVAEGDTLAVTLSATDADGDSLAYSSSGLPDFVSLSGNTLTLAPGFDDAGSYPVTVEVSDGTETDSQSFTIVVDGTNRAPVLDSVSDQTVAEGETLTTTLSATDADGDALTYSATGLPAFASLSGDTLTVAPGFEDAGSYPVTVEVSDGTDADSQTFTIVVGGTNQAPSITSSGDQASAEGDSVNLALTASDADGDALTFAATGLPANVSIDSSSGVISGALDYESEGTYNVSVTVTDDGSPALTASVSFNWTVTETNRAPELAAISDQTLAEGESFSVTLSATDADGDNLTYSASGLPTFAILSGNTLSVAPDFEDAGSYPVTVEVSDGTDGDSQSFTIVVGGTNQAPSITSPGDQNNVEGDSVNLALTANDADGNALTYAATGLPAGVSIDPSSGVISGALDYESEGTYNVSVRVTDDGSPALNASASFTWTVGETNRAPELAAVGDQSVEEGDTLIVTLNATDADGDALTYSASGLPAFASLSGNTLTLAPGFEDAGSYPVTVEVSDGVETDSQTFTIVVGGTNQAPSISSPDDQNNVEGDTVNLALTANDADGDALTYAATGLPAGISIDPSSGVISGALDYESEGTYSVTVTVTDDGSPALSASASFTWTVAETNRAPELVAISDQALAEGESLSVTLNATDADGDTLTYSASGLPAFVSLSGNTLTLAPSFEDAGRYPVTVEVSDGVETDSQTFTIVVGGTNQAPSITTPGGQANSEGDSVNLTLTASDADGDALTYSATGLPVGVSIDPATGVISGSLDYESEGTYNVSVTVTDDGSPALNASASFTWTVGETNRAPELTAVGDQTLAEGENLSVTLNATDADSDTLTYSVIGLPAFASLSGNTLTIAPGQDDAGSYPITVEVSDGEDSDSQSFTVVIDEGNTAPTLAPVSDLTVSEGETRSVGLSASDEEGNALVFSSHGLPAFITLNDAGDGSAQLTVTPGYSDEGDYSITITVSEAGDSGLSDSKTLTVKVTDSNRTPTVVVGDDRNVLTGSLVTLDGSSSSDADGDRLTFEWRFVSVPFDSVLTDDNLADRFSSQASFTVDSDGEYLLELEVADGTDAGVARLVVSATTANVAPNAEAGNDRFVQVFETVVLDGSASNDPDSQPLPLTYEWALVQVPSGSTQTQEHIAGASSVTASFVPEVEGGYAFELTVSDGEASDSDLVVIDVRQANVPPTASAGEDQIVALGDSVLVDGSASQDPDNYPNSLSYQWNFVSAPSASSLGDDHIAGAFESIAGFNPDVAGEYILRLMVTDGEASHSDQVVVTVQEPAQLPWTPTGVIGRARAYHVNLVWNESEYADNYVVYRRLDTESGFTALGSTTTLAFVDDMPTGTLYADYQVVARNANGQSDPSTVVRVLPRVRSR